MRRTFTNRPGETRGRRLRYGEMREFERDSGRIKARRVMNYSFNGLYVEEGIKCSRAAIRKISGMVTEAKRLMGIEEICKIPIVVCRLTDRLASFNPRTDVIFISSLFGSGENIRKIQNGYACPDNPMSTVVHELFHWSDAYTYRENEGVIKDAGTLKEYSIKQNEAAVQKLMSHGVNLLDAVSIDKEISRYAYLSYMQNNFDEIYAEYRTKRLLEE